MKRFIAELRRRGVLRTAVAYLVTAWLLVQVLETLFPVFGLPESGVRWVVLAGAIGFLPIFALYKFVFQQKVDPAGIDRPSIAVLPAHHLSALIAPSSSSAT